MQSSATTKITALEGLRGMCALSVLVMHLAYDSTMARTGGATFFPGYPAAVLAALGNVGVPVFFILSGFVIGIATPQPFSGSALRRYAIRRLLRLYPIYFVVLVLSFALARQPIVSFSFFAHAVFMQTWWVPTVSTNGVLWTLHLEFMFYVMFTLVWAGVVPLRAALVVTACCCIASPFLETHLIRVLAYFYLWLLGLWASRLRSESRESPRHYFWPSLFVGIAAVAANAVEVLVNKWRVSGQGFQSTVTMLLMSGILLAPIASLGGVDSPRMRQVVRTSLLLSAGSTLSLLLYSLRPSVPAVPAQFIAATFLALAALTYVAKVPPPIQSLQALAWLGGISYGMYVIQNPLEHFVYPLVPRDAPLATWWAVNAALLAGIAAAAYALEHFYQGAIMRMVLRRK